MVHLSELGPDSRCRNYAHSEKQCIESTALSMDFKIRTRDSEEPSDNLLEVLNIVL